MFLFSLDKYPGVELLDHRYYFLIMEKSGNSVLKNTITKNEKFTREFSSRFELKKESVSLRTDQ